MKRIVFLIFLTSNLIYGQTYDVCENAILVSCGLSVSLNVESNLFSNISNDCYFSSSDKDVWIKVIGTGSLIEILTDNEIGEIHTYTGTCNFLECKFDYDHRTNPLSLVIPTNIGQEYFFKLTFYDNILSVNVNLLCIDPIQNDNCVGALDLGIGQEFQGNTSLGVGQTPIVTCPLSQPDVWYQITGNGEIYYFDLLHEVGSIGAQVFIKDCESLEIVFHSDGLQSEFNWFPTSKNELYLIRIYNLEYQSIRRDSFMLKIMNRELAENDSCENARFINCNQMVIGSTLNATEDNPPPCNIFTQENLWYSLDGDGYKRTISLISGNIFGVSFRILEGDNCQEASCLSEFTLNRLGEESTFQTKTEKSYFISVSSSSSIPDDFSFQIEPCLTISDITASSPCDCSKNDNIQLSNGDFLFIDTLRINFDGYVPKNVFISALDSNLFDNNGESIANSNDIIHLGNNTLGFVYYVKPQLATEIEINIDNDIVRFQIDTCNSCITIPTISQWGLNITGLIMLIISVVSIKKYQKSVYKNTV